MVRLIMGQKGTGKTKQLITLIKEATEDAKGDLICLEKDTNLRHNIPHKARLISLAQYNFGSYDFLQGFISGLNASNYDTAHVFIDSLQKMVQSESEHELLQFLTWLERFGEREHIRFTITYSADPGMLGEEFRRFL